MAAVSHEIDPMIIQCMICHDDDTYINEDSTIDMRWNALSTCFHPVHKNCLEDMLKHNARDGIPNLCPNCREPFGRHQIENIEEGVRQFVAAKNEGRLGAFLRGDSPHIAAWVWRTGKNQRLGLLSQELSVPTHSPVTLLRRRVHAVVDDFFAGVLERISLVVNMLIFVPEGCAALFGYLSYRVVTGAHAFIADRTEEFFMRVFEKIELVARLVFGAFYAVTTQLPIAIAYLTITVVDGFFDVLDCCGEECCF